MKQVELGNYKNPEYRPGSKLKRALWYVVSFMFFQSYLFPFSGLKGGLLRAFGATIGLGVVIKPDVQIKYPWFLTVGEHCWIGERVWIDNLVMVTLESNVCLSQGAMLLTGNHNYKKAGFDLETGEIYLESGVWIGAKAVVCPGVHCHSHAVLGVGAIATANLKAFTVYGGNPAMEVRERVVMN